MVNLLNLQHQIPLVSIVFPIHNSEIFLRESIESLIAQSYKNLEIIALNDGSTDRSKHILRQYKDIRIKHVEHTKNRGLVSTLNEGFALARGTYIARMDPDDISDTDRIKEQVAYLEKHPEIDVLGTWIKVFGKDNYIWETHRNDAYIKAKLLFENPIAHPSVMIRVNSLNKTKIFFNERFPSAEDFMFWAELAASGFRFANLDKALLEYRTHDSQIGVAKQAQQQRSSWKVRKYSLDRLNITPSKTEISIHQKLSSWRKLNSGEFAKTAVWLSKILIANKYGNVFDREALNRVIGERWLVSCYLSSKNITDTLLNLVSSPSLLYLAIRTYILRKFGKLYD